MAIEKNNKGANKTPKRTKNKAPLAFRKVDKKEVVETLKEIKGENVERGKEKSDNPVEKQTETITLADGNKNTENREANKVTREISSFIKLMSEENYSDKKLVFNFSLSGECCEDIENLSLYCNFKLKTKVTRNDIMRKIIEKFTSKDLPKLLKELESM